MGDNSKGHRQLQHPTPMTVSIQVSDGKVVGNTSSANIRKRVLEDGVVLLKNAFEADRLKRIRRSVFEWSQRTEPENIPFSEAQKTHHKYNRNQHGAVFPRLYHVYYFYDLLDSSPPPSDIHETVQPIYNDLLTLYNEVNDTDRDLVWTEDEPHFHPQINQYPPGGGYFAMHRHFTDVHNLEYSVMQMNMIVSLSEHETDYSEGGVRFIKGGDIYDLSTIHDIGDVAIFRYDLPHAVLPTDPTDSLTWDTEAGRWSLLMPFHW